MRLLRWTAAALAAALLAACGGGNDDPPARGAVLSGLVLGQATKATIDAGTAASGLQALSGAARCDVTIRYVQYSTRAPGGKAANASAGVLVPGGSDPTCTGARPVVLYAHGTATNKSKNMALVSSDTEAGLQMAMYAAQGFIVVAPNYLGYDGTLDWHPYLNAQAQATDMIDGLRAAKAHLAEVGGTTASPILLLTGYSQGGYVAMATHREIETNYASEFQVTASVPMSGPYNLVGFSDIITAPQGQVNAGALIFTPMLLTSYQRSYGDVYAAASDAYQSPYDTTAPGIFPSDSSVSDLLAAGKLPADPTLRSLWGEGGLLKDSFRASYLAQIGQETQTGFRKHLVENTLLGWTPSATSGVALCGGAQDPTVFYAVNTQAAQADFASRNKLVPAFNLEDQASLAPLGPTNAAQLYGGFQLKKAAAGDQVLAQYHGTLVPPFCTAIARGYFAARLAALAAQ